MLAKLVELLEVAAPLAVLPAADDRVDDAPRLFDFVGAGGDHDNVGVREGAQLPAHFDTVERGQPEVEDDDIRWSSVRGGDCGRSIAGDLDIETTALKVVGDDLGEVRLVLDNHRAQAQLRPRFGHRRRLGLGNNRIHASIVA